MNLKEIKELAELVGRERLSGLEIERPGFRIRIEGPRAAEAAGMQGRPVYYEPALAPMPAPLPAPPPQTITASPGPAIEAEGLHVITSPIVGTFYRSPNPEAEAFVKVGDTVEKGKTLCIIEAMKLMNEIEADVAGEVVEIYPSNSQPVEFGEKLFAIRAR